MEFERTGSRQVLQLVSTYLSFLHYAQTPPVDFTTSCPTTSLAGRPVQRGLFRACAVGLRLCSVGRSSSECEKVARQIFDAALPWVSFTTSLRARAYMGMGCYCYLQAEPESKEVRTALKGLADSLCRDFRRNSKKDWAWFENTLTYSNGMMPRLLFMAYKDMGKEKYLQTAEESLDFLTSVCIVDGKLHPVGCNGWYIRNRERAWYDQQPVDPMAHTLSYLSAYDATSDGKYLCLAKTSFDWFFGHNSVGEPLYDP